MIWVTVDMLGNGRCTKAHNNKDLLLRYIKTTSTMEAFNMNRAELRTPRHSKPVNT